MDVANVVDRHLSESIFQVNALVDVLAEQIIEVGNATEMAHPGKIQLMQAYCKSLVGCNAIGITDPMGLIVANSALEASPNIDVRDRAYYKAVTSTGLRFIGPAVVSRVPGNPILFHIARPVFDHAGKLKAVIVVGMETEGLAETYFLMDFALKPSIAIFKANGDVIATYPNMAKAVGENKSKTRLFQHFLVRSPSSVIESTEGDVDSKVVPKILAYKKMADFGLVVAVGLNYKSAFHDWRARTSSTLVVSILLLGLILVVLRYGYVAMKQQVTAEARNEHLQRLSYLDALTGISNRRRFDETIQHD